MIRVPGRVCCPLLPPVCLVTGLDDVGCGEPAQRHSSDIVTVRQHRRLLDQRGQGCVQRTVGVLQGPDQRLAGYLAPKSVGAEQDQVAGLQSCRWAAAGDRRPQHAAQTAGQAGVRPRGFAPARAHVADVRVVTGPRVHLPATHQVKTAISDMRPVDCAVLDHRQYRCGAWRDQRMLAAAEPQYRIVGLANALQHEVLRIGQRLACSTKQRLAYVDHQLRGSFTARVAAKTVGKPEQECFGAAEEQAAVLVGMSATMALVAQGVGGAIGGIFAPAKVILGCSTVGADEGTAMRRSLAYGMAILAILAVVTGAVFLAQR